ncbi:uncharacterized protein LOC129890667 [Solanum dulcamara]|uniref:uncharacterized protein LOC129890667 n=1 Tax=Solanum dulcamara TaxID=45834 RepID=UPI00248580D3|nr:uncharacterized protein LOC129890667 [Solanum dulcamara]
MEAWNFLCDIFQDNKHSRVVTLEYDFTHVNMADFSNVSAYFQHLKYLADQLKNVGSPIANDRLVLQLVSGLTEPYQVARSSEGRPNISDSSSSNRKPNGEKRNHNRNNNGRKYHGKNGGRVGGKRVSSSGGNAGCGGQLGSDNIHDTGQ